LPVFNYPNMELVIELLELHTGAKVNNLLFAVNDDK
jgi:hypothetical protein